jgi:OPA family glycerol-3-phosphate transporter-like MFS transporter
VQWVFFVPPIILGALALADFVLVKDTPGEAGHRDFDTADASSHDAAAAKPAGVFDVARMMLTNRVILVIAAIEFCSGFLRNALMKWFQRYADFVGLKGTFVPANWGMLLCCAGILGGMFAGAISDHVFGSRRGPVATILYGGMIAGSLLMFPLLGHPALGWVAVFMSLCIIGVHGMLSGTASMDFGGKKNVGVAVGIIDGFVYLGTAAQALTLKHVLPDKEPAKIAANWYTWPAAILPLAVIGLLLATRVWNARPQPKKPAAVPTPDRSEPAEAA